MRNMKELHMFLFSFFLFFELLINYQINKNAKTNFLRQKQKHFSIENNAIDTNGKIEKDILKFNHGEIFQNVLFFFPLSGKMCYFSTEKKHFYLKKCVLFKFHE